MDSWPHEATSIFRLACQTTKGQIRQTRIQVTQNEADYIITSDSPNGINDVAQRQNERMKSNVRNRNDTREAARSEISDWPNPAVSSKNKEKKLAESVQKITMQFLQNEILPIKTLHKILRKREMIIVPEISQDGDENESLSPRGEKYNPRPIHNPNYSEDARYWIELGLLNENPCGCSNRMDTNKYKQKRNKATKFTVQSVHKYICTD